MTILRPGQVWRYRTRLHETDSRLAILRVDDDGPRGRSVHITIFGLRLPGSDDAGVTLGHLPFEEEALRKSLVALEGQFAGPLDLEGYHEWRAAFEEGRAGVFTSPLDATIDGLEKGMRGLANGA